MKSRKSEFCFILNKCPVYLRFAIFHLQIFNQTGFDVISLVRCIFYLTSLAMTICSDARRNISLPSWDRDSPSFISSFSHVKIYHNFYRDSELIHFRLSFISRLENTNIISLAEFRCCTCFRTNDMRYIFIISFRQF